MDISKTKLDFILACRWIPPSDQGGVAMHNGYLIESVKDLMNVKVLTIEDYSNRVYYEEQGITIEGIRANVPSLAIRLAKTAALKNGLRAWKDWRISLAMAKALETSSPDVVEFMDIHSESYAFLKRNPKEKRKTKVVIRSHTPWGLLRTTYLQDEIKGLDGWWAKKREQFCFDACDWITTPSQDLKEKLIKLYRLPAHKINVIPNILDTEHFKPISFQRKEGRFTFLHVGRFERAKGVITMIKAFIEVTRQYPDLHLINVGKPRGSAYQECLNLLQSANLMEKVTFTGFIPYEELPQCYAEVDAVIVAPEIYESFSYTVAQAMACGKTVIASDSGGMPETVNYGDCGILFKAKSVESLTTKMIQVISDKKLQKLGDMGRDYCTKKFSIPALQEVFANFYSGL